jgi:hypothetical protein
MTKEEKRLNEISLLADRMVERLHLMSRLLSRFREDAETQNEQAVYLIDEYDRVIARWNDEDEDE